jgi:hypothetical protein
MSVRGKRKLTLAYLKHVSVTSILVTVGLAEDFGGLVFCHARGNELDTHEQCHKLIDIHSGKSRIVCLEQPLESVLLQNAELGVPAGRDDEVLAHLQHFLHFRAVGLERSKAGGVRGHCNTESTPEQEEFATLRALEVRQNTHQFGRLIPGFRSDGRELSQLSNAQTEVTCRLYINI